MPVVNIEFDNSKVSKKEIDALANAAYDVIHAVTKIDDIPVYANTAKVRVKAAPIEIWMQISDFKVKNEEEMFSDLKKGFHNWKVKAKFKHKINFTLIPIHWKVEVDV